MVELLEPGSAVPRAPADPRPSRAKAPTKLKSLEANFSSRQESSSTAAEEKQTISDLPFLPETKSEIKRQRIA
jgi:hypothetical protein